MTVFVRLASPVKKNRHRPFLNRVLEEHVTSLIIDHIHKSYGDVHAVNDLSINVGQGQIFGLLGPNGAGKTTTIRMIMDIIKPDQGTIKILGQENTVELRNQVGYLPEERGLYKKMTVQDVILFFAEIKGVKKAAASAKIDMWLEKLQLLDWKEKKVEELSRGMQQKLQFICTVLHEPKLIILDEPFTGLDPVNTNLIKDVILDLKKNGATIIFSTHLMEQVEKLCEAICLINNGRSVLQGTLSEVKGQFSKNRIKMRYTGNATFLADKTLVDSHDDYGNYVEIRPVSGVSPQDILARAMKEATIEQFEIAEPSLNEIFINAVK